MISAQILGLDAAHPDVNIIGAPLTVQLSSAAKAKPSGPCWPSSQLNAECGTWSAEYSTLRTPHSALRP
ncbi:MAG: hypothetical protein IPM76_20840 [Chloroflexi bacterium]|nr:hypothetical protein [Chloroflexota bacterium]